MQIPSVPLAEIGQELPLEVLCDPQQPVQGWSVVRPPFRETIAAPVFTNCAEGSPEGAAFALPDLQRSAWKLCRVNNAFVYGPFCFVALPDGRVVAESCNLQAPHHLYWNFQMLAHGFTSMKGMDPSYTWGTHDGALFLGSYFSPGNYYHWLMDGLSQIGPFFWLPSLQQNCKMVLSFLRKLPYQLDTAVVLAQQGATILPYAGDRLFARSLFFLSKENMSGADRHKVQFLRSLFSLPDETCDRQNGQRLFLTRRDVPTRSLRNGREVEALMQKLGYHVVTVGGMSVPEQVALFSQAAVVVGTHGAGLTNAAYMRRGAGLVELTSQPCLSDRNFQRIASAAELHYAAVIGDDLEVSDDPGMDPKNLSFGVPLAEIVAAVEAVEAAVFGSVSGA